MKKLMHQFIKKYFYSKQKEYKI